MQKKTIVGLEADNKQLRELVDELKNDLSSIAKLLFEGSEYYNKGARDCLFAIGKLRGAAKSYHELEKQFEGREFQIASTLREENSKLWYMLRVAMGDKSTEQIKFKPGDIKNLDSLDQIKRPFRN